MNERRKMIARALCCGLVLAACLGWLRTAGTAEQLPENLLRLHVVANSDSEADQALKLQVRDAVLQEAGQWCRDAESMEEANVLLCTHLEGITLAAEDVVRREGFSDRVRAQVTEEYYPTRQYEGFTLPAGRYRSLRVTIGEGEGRNWWCVVFPPLCTAASGDVPAAALAAGLTEDQVGLITESEGYVLKSKAVEFWQSLRERWD